MDIHTSKISTKGQATIPSTIRKLLGLSAGDEMLFEHRDDIVTIRKVQPMDIVYLQSLDQQLSAEWNSTSDAEAYDEL